MSLWGFVSLITGFSLSGLVFGDTEDPPEGTEVRVVKEPEERSLSLRSGWRSGAILIMMEAVASRVTAGCAGATGTTEHAPECPPSPYTHLTSHTPHAVTLPTLLRMISRAPHSALMLEGRGIPCRWSNRSLKQIFTTLRKQKC